MSPNKLKLKKKFKSSSSSKSLKASSTKDTTSKSNPFDPKAIYHLFNDTPGDEPEFHSFVELTALCAKTEELIAAAKADGLLPRIRIVKGQRCPVAGGALPRVFIDGKWIPLIHDVEAAIEDCPPDGAILGTEEVTVEDEDLSHLDREELIADADDDEMTVPGVAKLSIVPTENKVAQIFGQDKE